MLSNLALLLLVACAVKSPSLRTGLHLRSSALDQKQGVHLHICNCTLELLAQLPATFSRQTKALLMFVADPQCGGATCDRNSGLSPLVKLQPAAQKTFAAGSLPTVRIFDAAARSFLLRLRQQAVGRFRQRRRHKHHGNVACVRKIAIVRPLVHQYDCWSRRRCNAVCCRCCSW